MKKKEKCDCGICSVCNEIESGQELSVDNSGVMLIEILDPRDEMIRGLAQILPPMNIEEIVLLNNLREESGLIKIAAKHKPNNPKLWASCLADARKRFQVCPSAYCNAFAAKKYKKRGGTWKTVNKKGGKK